MHYHLLLFFLFLNSSLGFSQTAVLRGVVMDENNKPVSSARIQAISKTYSLSVSSDTNGNYRLSDLLPGRYYVAVSHHAYQEKIAFDVLVAGHKEVVIDWILSSVSKRLNTVIVTGEQDHEFTAEQGLRFAAAFNDPGRLATSTASVITADDQSNNVSVRGAHPFQNKWFIEGVEVLNPNHLENAGTFSDRPTLSGGGVNLFSTQVIGGSRFLKGVLPFSYNNVSGGAFDIRFRPGNHEAYEHTAVMSLLGLEVATEGPLAKDLSYLINLRYSTVGVLSALGINFGNEKINYYDGTAVLDYRRKNSNLRFWLMTGESKNDHSPVSDSSEAVVFKDLQSIKYKSGTTISGITFNSSLRGKGLWKTTAAMSLKSVSRGESDPYFDPQGVSENYDQQLYSLNSNLKYSLARRIDLLAGASLSRTTASTNVCTLDNDVFSPFAGLKYSTSSFEFSGAVTGFQASNVFYIDPRLNLFLSLSKFGSISLSAGDRRHSGINESWLIYCPSAFLIQSRNLQATHTIVVKGIVFNNSVFDDKSELKSSEVILLPPFTSLHSSGWELTVDKKMNHGYYGLLAFSAFTVKETSADQTGRGPYDVRHALNFNAGKEFVKGKRIFNIDYHFHYHGSPLQRSIDYNASYFSNTTVFAYQSVGIGSYYRHDLRLSVTRSKEKNSSTLFLDIQNLTSRKNNAGFYYDPFLKEIKLRYQLGIIPVLGYRVNF